jgi:hypothetical protein
MVRRAVRLEKLQTIAVYRVHYDDGAWDDFGPDGLPIKGGQMTYKRRPLGAEDDDSTADVLAVLEDEYGGRARIIMDDHCYVLQLHRVENDGQGGGQGGWRSVTHWFREAVNALHDLVFLHDTTGLPLDGGD